MQATWLGDIIWRESLMHATLMCSEYGIWNEQFSQQSFYCQIKVLVLEFVWQ